VRRAGAISPLVVGLAASAALGAEPHAAAEHASIVSLFLPILNFVLFAVLFWRYAWPVIRAALLDRRRTVEREIAESDRVHREAEDSLAEIQARRARVQEEGARLIDELRAQGRQERERLIAAARQGAERIRADVRLRAEQEAMRAAHEVRAEIAERVVARVAAALRERVTADDEQRYATEFVAAVESGDAR